jgi:hypothetical protein
MTRRPVLFYSVTIFKEVSDETLKMVKKIGMAQKEVFSYFQDLTARTNASFESLSNTILKENFISF